MVLVTAFDEAYPAWSVRGISFKLQEEERERKDQYVPEISALDVSQSSLVNSDADTKDLLKSLGVSFPVILIKRNRVANFASTVRLPQGQRWLQSLSSSRLSALAASVGKLFIPTNRGNLLTSEGWVCLPNVVKLSMISYFRHPNKKAKMIFHASKSVLASRFTLLNVLMMM